MVVRCRGWCGMPSGLGSTCWSRGGSTRWRRTRGRGRRQGRGSSSRNHQECSRECNSSYHGHSSSSLQAAAWRGGRSGSKWYGGPRSEVKTVCRLMAGTDAGSTAREARLSEPPYMYITFWAHLSSSHGAGRPSRHVSRCRACRPRPAAPAPSPWPGRSGWSSAPPTAPGGARSARETAAWCTDTQTAASEEEAAHPCGPRLPATVSSHLPTTKPP